MALGMPVITCVAVAMAFDCVVDSGAGGLVDRGRIAGVGGVGVVRLTINAG